MLGVEFFPVLVVVVVEVVVCFVFGEGEQDLFGFGDVFAGCGVGEQCGAVCVAGQVVDSEGGRAGVYVSFDDGFFVFCVEGLFYFCCGSVESGLGFTVGAVEQVIITEVVVPVSIVCFVVVGGEADVFFVVTEVCVSVFGFGAGFFFVFVVGEFLDAVEQVFTEI